MGTITIYSRYTPTWTPGPWVAFAKSINVLSTGTNVVFNTAFVPGTNYNIRGSVYNPVTKENVYYEITNKTVNGFTITPIDDGIFEFEIIIRD